MEQCACGIPSKANYYVSVIVGCPGETEEIDGYYCSEHEPDPEDLVPDGWDMLESSSTELR